MMTRIRIGIVVLLQPMMIMMMMIPGRLAQNIGDHEPGPGSRRLRDSSHGQGRRPRLLLRHTAPPAHRHRSRPRHHDTHNTHVNRPSLPLFEKSKFQPLESAIFRKQKKSFLMSHHRKRPQTLNFDATITFIIASLGFHYSVKLRHGIQFGWDESFSTSCAIAAKAQCGCAHVPTSRSRRDWGPRASPARPTPRLSRGGQSRAGRAGG